MRQPEALPSLGARGTVGGHSATEVDTVKISDTMSLLARLIYHRRVCKAYAGHRGQTAVQGVVGSFYVQFI